MKFAALRHFDEFYPSARHGVANALKTGQGFPAFDSSMTLTDSQISLSAHNSFLWSFLFMLELKGYIYIYFCCASAAAAVCICQFGCFFALVSVCASSSPHAKVPRHKYLKHDSIPLEFYHHQGRTPMYRYIIKRSEEAIRASCTCHWPAVSLSNPRPFSTPGCLNRGSMYHLSRGRT